MTNIHFTSLVQHTNDSVSGSTVLYAHLPSAASKQFSSRGTVMIEGVVKGCSFLAPLEPDGRLGHWLGFDRAAADTLGIREGDEIAVECRQTQHWPEPTIPPIIKKVLTADAVAKQQWDDTTPMARWEWLRWVDSVKTDKARQARPEKLCSMLRAGKRRPCCFNRAAQTPPKSLILV